MSKHVMVTCYDATFSKLIAETEAVDSILVGDSLGMVVGGHDTTLPVTIDHMVYHLSAVIRGLKKSKSKKIPLVIADMPAETYNNPQDALKNGKRLIDAGAEVLKVEGPVISVVQAFREAGIRVCGHIGLTPQSIQNYRVQGKSEEEAARLKKEAKDLDAAGIEFLVLEMIPAPLAREISKSIRSLTVGIGAGKDCGGQVLVLYDLLGFNPDFNPKFLKKFSNGAAWVTEALNEYSKEVRAEAFPSSQNSFGI